MYGVIAPSREPATRASLIRIAALAGVGLRHGPICSYRTSTSWTSWSSIYWWPPRRNAPLNASASTTRSDVSIKNCRLYPKRRTTRTRCKYKSLFKSSIYNTLQNACESHSELCCPADLNICKDIVFKFVFMFRLIVFF